MGSLGFLMPIRKSFRSWSFSFLPDSLLPPDIEGFPQALDELMESRSAMLLRMRLQCVVMEDGKPVPPQGHESSSASSLPHLPFLEPNKTSQLSTLSTKSPSTAVPLPT